MPVSLHIFAPGFWHRSLTLILAVFFLMLVGSEVSAYVSGPCSECHTMHYSQDGGALSIWGQDGVGGPFDALLTNDCIGCHTGDNLAGGKTPFVMPEVAVNYGGINGTGTEASATTLAGGSFFWVLGNDTCGHNVADYCGEDTTMLVSDGNLPPGFVSGRPTGGSPGTTPGGGSWGTQQITCAGTYGCHGSHATANQAQAIYGAHHALSGPEIYTPQNSPADYRMLVGIAGIEDSAWEFQPTVNRHNQYHGVDDPGSTDTSTISYFCSQCHGRFHFNDDVTAPTSSPWIRHPTNFDLSRASGDEYDNYNDGVGIGVYSLVAPVASDLGLPANQGVIQAEVMEAGATDDAIITCLSCHRAHGSPYYKSLRWNYTGFVNGGDCTVCHTSKK